jgi:chloramphenicol-sensitive protein RarD
VFIWALQNARMVEASLGYYINPLVTVLLGVVFLGERLRGALLLALALAAAGVANEVIAFGGLPWVSLSLALSFGVYGLVRKTIGVDSVLGLTVETGLLAPFALAYGGSLAHSGALAFGGVDVGRDLGLMAAGVVTTIPLVAFGAAALRLPLWALGFLQYFSPSITLLLALFVYDEPFVPSRAITFALIWAALAIFSTAELLRARRQLA